MARKSGKSSGSTKRIGSSRNAASRSNTSGARGRGRATDGANAKPEVREIKTAATARTRATNSTKRQQVTNRAAAAAAPKRSSSRPEKRQSSDSKIKSVLGSPVVRNVVAAVLASAAAALLQRKSSGSDHREKASGTRDVDVDRAGPPSINSSPVKRTRSKAAAAANIAKAAAAKKAKQAVAKAATAAVTNSAAAVVGRAARKGVPKTVKATVTKGAKAALTKAMRVNKTTASRGEIVPPTNARPTRKTRSDLGIKRGPRKASPGSEPRGGLELVGLGDTETSPIALDAATAASPDVIPGPSDEQVAQAHPS